MQTVIFDMDGVLFDTEKLAIEAWDWVGEQIGIGKAGYMVLKTLGRTRVESVKIFEKEFGNEFNDNEFQKYYSEFSKNYFNKNGMPIKTGVNSLLKYLKSNNYKVAVASSSSKKSVMHHLEMAGITYYFDKIICGDMVEKSKPEPDIYLTACKALGEKAENCYAIEDSRAGLLSASKAGCKVVYVPDLYVADDEIQKLIFKQFNNLSEFENYLKK